MQSVGLSVSLSFDVPANSGGSVCCIEHLKLAADAASVSLLLISPTPCDEGRKDLVCWVMVLPINSEGVGGLAGYIRTAYAY